MPPGYEQEPDYGGLLQLRRLWFREMPSPKTTKPNLRRHRYQQVQH
jgi:hypothetical protein